MRWRRIVLTPLGALLILVPALWPAAGASGPQPLRLAPPAPLYGLSPLPAGMAASGGDITLVRRALAVIPVPRVPSGEFATSPRFAQRYTDPRRGDSLLVADRTYHRVIDISAKGMRVYDDLVGPWGVQHLTNGNVLIADRYGYKIVEVSLDTGQVVWQYGTGSQSSAPGGLYDPFYAERLGGDPNGLMLVVDRKNIDRVFAVDRQKKTQWTWTGLQKVKNAQWVDGGTNVLLAEEDAKKISIVRAGSNPRVEVWSFGWADMQAVGLGDGFKPDGATLSKDGKRVIVADDWPENRGRVFIIDRATKALVDVFGNAPSDVDPVLGAPRSVSVGPAGTVLIADDGRERVVEYGYPASAEAQSDRLDFDSITGGASLVSALTWTAAQPAGTKAELFWRINNTDTWTSAGSKGTYAGFKNTTGRWIHYRVRLTTTDACLAPMFRSPVFSYWPPGSMPPPSQQTTEPPHSGATTGSTDTSPTTSTATGTTASRMRLTYGTGGSGGAGTGGGTGSGTGSGAEAGGTGQQTGWLFKKVAGEELPSPAAGSAEPAPKESSRSLSVLAGLWILGVAWRPRPPRVET